jgi:hypothetical protein
MLSGFFIYFIAKIEVIIGMFLNDVGYLTILVFMWYIILIIIRVLFEVDKLLNIFQVKKKKLKKLKSRFVPSKMPES